MRSLMFLAGSAMLSHAFAQSLLTLEQHTQLLRMRGEMGRREALHKKKM